MQRIVTIVEGDGDVQAVPILLSRLLNYYGWLDVSQSEATHDNSKPHKDTRFE